MHDFDEGDDVESAIECVDKEPFIAETVATYCTLAVVVGPRLSEAERLCRDDAERDRCERRLANAQVVLRRYTAYLAVAAGAAIVDIGETRCASQSCPVDTAGARLVITSVHRPRETTNLLDDDGRLEAGGWLLVEAQLVGALTETP